MEKVRKCFGSAGATALGVNLISFSSGGAYTWTSPVSLKLNSNDPTINPLARPITTFEDSLLASIMIMAALIGTLSGSCSNKIGKRKTLLFFGVPMVLSHVMCAFATNIHIFLAARFLMGVGVGSVFSIVPIYVSEIAKDENRGSLGCFLGLMGALGQVLVYSVGPFVSIQIFSFINLVPLVLFYAYALTILPESPVDLVRVGDDEQAEIVLVNLRGAEHYCEAKKELLLLTETLKTSQQEKSGLYDLFRDQILRKSLLIACNIMFFQQFSGVCAIIAFMQTIVESSGSQIPSASIVIAISIIALISSFACSQILDRIGRKIALLLSSIMCFFALSVLGVYFVFKSQNLGLVASISWLPIVCLVLFIIFFSLGLAIVPWVLVGELFPPKYNAIASMVVAFSNFICGSTVSFCFPFLFAFVGEAGTFFIFGGILAVGSVYIALVLPETSGKTILEIQAVLMGFPKK